MGFVKRWLRRNAVLALVVALGAAIVALAANWVGGRRLEAEVAALHAAGGTLDIWKLAPAEVPPEENAARLYRAAALLKLEPPGGQHTYIMDFVRREAATPTATALARAWVERNRVALGLVHEAARLPRASYDLEYADGFAMKMDHLPELHRLARLPAAEARLALADGRPEEALRSIAAALHAANSIAQEPVLFSHEMAQATLGLAVGVLEGVPEPARRGPAGAATRAELERLAATSIRRALEGERAMGYAALTATTGWEAMGGVPFPGGPYVHSWYLARLDAAACLAFYRELLDALERPGAARTPIPWYAYATSALCEVLDQVVEQEAEHRARLDRARSLVEVR